VRNLIALALVVASPALFADGNSASATAKASVNIVAPLNLIATSDMNFGNIVVDTYDKGGKVTLASTVGPNSEPKAALTNFVNTAIFTGPKIDATAAFFHFQRDERYENVNVIIDPLVTLSGGRGPDVKLATTHDLPADACGYFHNPHGVVAKHFSVGGTLDIPGGAFGQKNGTIKVTVAYK